MVSLGRMLGMKNPDTVDIPYAATEDSEGYWDAAKMGNKKGRSFVTHQGKTRYLDEIPKAKTEDSEGYWDAKTMGNKKGRSFIREGGKTLYLPD
jgi:hypothetical protein